MEEEVEATKEEGLEEEESSKVEEEEKEGGFAGSPVKREAGMFVGRANPRMEVTPTTIINIDCRRLQAWVGGALGGEGGEMAMPATRDLNLIHLAFRRLVGVLVRCQPPSVASQLNK